MKISRPTASLLVLALTLAAAPVQALKTADLQNLSFDAVAGQLGPPRSTLAHGDTVIAHFAAAKVVFVSDTVSHVTPVPAAERETPMERRQRIEAAKDQIGPKLLNRYRASGEVGQLPLRAQKEFWLSFQHRFPDLDLTRELAPVTARIEALESEERRAREAAQAAATSALLAKLAAQEQQKLRRVYRPVYYSGHRPRHHADRHRGPRGAEHCREEQNVEDVPVHQRHALSVVVSR